MTEIRLTINDNDKTVEAQMGDSIVIELPENPTTGYRWTFDVKEGAGMAYLADSRYAVATGSGIGGGGMRTFIIKIQSSGIATIDMKLRQQWEPESEAIDRFKAVIKSQ
jgi:inhibitor of cysteine peptidase